MANPPGVSEQDFSAALRQFEDAVGEEWVFSSDEDVALYRDAYSPFWDEEEERVASAAVAPDNVEEVQQVMRIANRYSIPIYPISTGRNLGYGGSAPALSGSVVLDLKRMNRVLEVSEENAYALVEPGVSYFDLYRHIQDLGLKLMIDVPSPGWGSPIGNALDHGGGRTPMSDHFGSHCGMEVVLANGDVLRTGMGALPGAETWQQFKYGIGPEIDGIFAQSNFAVITKMGFWLQPEPEVVRNLSVIAPRHDDAVPMVGIMSNLFYAGVIDAYISFISPVLNGPRDDEFDALLARGSAVTGAEWDQFAASRDLKFWNATFSFFGPEDVIDARVRHVKERFSAIAGVEFNDGPDFRFPMSAEEREQVPPPNKRVLGIPSLDTFTGRTPETPEVADGHIGLFSVIPMNGMAVLEALKTIGHAFAQDDVGASLGVIASYHPRTFMLTSMFQTSRTDGEANRRTRAAYERAVKLTAEHGWGQYRAHVAFGDLALSGYSFNDNALSRFHATLKDAVDPNGILSAGRYGIWPKSMRGSA